MNVITAREAYLADLCGWHAEYPFAKYNVQNADYTYSQDEYTRLLEGMSWVNPHLPVLMTVLGVI